MAPRRGGSSSGGSSSFGSVNNQCADAGAFTSPRTQAVISIFAIYLVVYLIIFFIWYKKYKANQKVKTVLRGWVFGLGLFLMVIRFIAFVINYTLMECLVFRSPQDYNSAVAASTFSGHIAELLLIGTLVFRVTNALFALVGTRSLIPTIVNGIAFGIVVVLGVAWLGLYSYLLAVYDSARYDTYDDVRLIEIKVYTAQDIIILLLAVSIVACLVVALAKLKSKGIAAGSLKFFIPAFSVVFIGWRLHNVIDDVYFSLQGHSITFAGSIVDLVFLYGLGALSFLFTIFIIASPALSTAVNATYDTAAGGKAFDTQYASYQPATTGPEPPFPSQATTPQPQYYNPVQQMETHNQWGGSVPVSTQPVAHKP